VQVSAGRAHTCAVKANGDIDCWGFNGQGRAADQTGPYVQVSAGRAHTCAVKANGDVDCWGSNGLGQAADQAGPYGQVSAGFAHTCAVKASGALACWGDNSVGQATPPSEAPERTALSPANLWIGLKNSDAVGLRVDLRAEVYVDDDVLIGAGQLDNVSTESSGFNNALLRTIPLALSNGSVEVPAGAELVIKVLVRRTCSGGGHNSGTVRLWYNGAAIDTGSARNAGSRFDATIDGVSTDYFLRTGAALDEMAGTAQTFVDAAVNSAQPCPARPFISFGAWSLIVP
jgi:hypothetical protein